MGILNVAIADDNERMVEILDSIVKKDDEIRIVGKANNGEDVYHMIKEKEPDVVLLDLIMPKLDGLSVMERINQDQTIKKHPKLLSSLQSGRKESLKTPSILVHIIT